MLTANETIARMLEELADREELRGTSYKPRAYRRAARNIRHAEDPLSQLRQQGRLQEIEGVGDAIRAKIIEALDTGGIDALDRLREKVPVDIDTLGLVRGLGTKKLRRLWNELDVTTLDDLEAAARGGQIGQLDGFGPKTVSSILDQIERVRKASNRWRLSDAEATAAVLLQRLETHDAIETIESAGSLRRRSPVTEGLSLVASTLAPEEALDALEELPETRERVQRSKERATVQLVTGQPVELICTRPTAFGTHLLTYTGNTAHVEALQDHADEQGLHLDEAGLFEEGDHLAGAHEDEVYGTLGLPTIPPELREGLREVEAATEDQLPCLLDSDEIRGDLQMHTTYSDGTTSVREMAQKADELGYEYILTTDHGPSLSIANAPSVDELYEQRDEIQDVNEDEDIQATVLWGVEANIQSDGIDVPREVCEEMDLVVASLHDTVEDATDRVVNAFERYPVDIFGHPTNRKINKREGNTLEMDRVVAAAKDERVALEINAQPKRLDLDWREAHTYRNEVPFVISTDAHSPRGMEFMPYGVDQARKAWLTSDNVLNAKPLDELLAALRPGS